MSIFTATISEAHSLELVPVDNVTFFADFGSRAEMVCKDAPLNARAIPGTLFVTSSGDESGKDKEIQYKRRAISEYPADELQQLASVLLVAIYTDAAGTRRVCGSPSFPLRLSYILDHGIFDCTLRGRTTSEDPVLVGV